MSGQQLVPAAKNVDNSSSSLNLRMLFCVLISVLILIPCFWLPRIEAGDLASHTYNAWLASLIVQGKAPGLWLARQSNNVLFDTGLSWLASRVGFRAGETIAVCISVLIVFWGSFALVSAIGGRPGYFLVPLLSIVAYGWTFHMGFFNFDLSIGLACTGLAVLWRAKGWGHLWVAPFVPFICSAHPLGLAWLLAVGGYMMLIKQLNGRWHLLVALGALLCALLFRFYLNSNFQTNGWTGPVHYLLGTGQVILTRRYDVVALIIALAILGAVVMERWPMKGSKSQGGSDGRGGRAGKVGKGSRRVRDQRQPGREWTSWFPWPLQLYAVSVLTLLILPDTILFPEYRAPLNFIATRFSIATAIMACCCLNALGARKWFGLLSGAIAVVYFIFVYQDERKIYQFERQAEALVQQLPRSARVFTTIFPFRDFRLYTHHVVDRACIGHCFNVGNYEASTGQFRVRAEPGNGFVVTGPGDPIEIETGKYVVRSSEVPAWHIFQCGPTEVDLCMRPLRPGPLWQIPSDQILHARNLMP